MKNLFVLLLLGFGCLVRGAQSDLMIEHHVEEIPLSSSMEEAISKEISISPRSSNYSGKELPGLDEGEDSFVEADKILNLGSRIWKVIEKNQPVLSVKHLYANGLPKGVQSSEDLDGFSDVNATAFRVWGRNLFGVKVYDVEYVAVHRHGGSYRGVGKYIENAAVIPTHIHVLFGYTLNYSVSSVNVVNIGTRENPVASLLLEAEIYVSTVLQKTVVREVFSFRGDSPDVRVLR